MASRQRCHHPARNSANLVLTSLRCRWRKPLGAILDLFQLPLVKICLLDPTSTQRNLYSASTRASSTSEKERGGYSIWFRISPLFSSLQGQWGRSNIISGIQQGWLSRQQGQIYIWWFDQPASDTTRTCKLLWPGVSALLPVSIQLLRAS